MKQRPSGKVMTSVSGFWGCPLEVDTPQITVKGPAKQRPKLPPFWTKGFFQPFIFFVLRGRVSFREGIFFGHGALDIQICFFFERGKMCSCLGYQTHMG